MDDVETGTRAFELSGEDRLLRPYLEGRVAIPRDMKALRALVNDNPAQERHLDELESGAKRAAEFDHPRSRAARRKRLHRAEAAAGKRRTVAHSHHRSYRAGPARQ